MNAQEAHDALSDVLKDIGGAIEALLILRNNLCVGAVRAQHDAVMLRHVEPESLHSSVANLVVQLCGETGSAENTIGMIDANLRDCAAALRNAISDMTAAYNDKAKEAKNAAAEAAALTKRLRAHACHSPEVRETVWGITGGRCFYCDTELVKSAPIDPSAPGTRSNIFHIDHIVPKDAGGPDHISNYVPACHSCNSSKGAKSYVEFTRKRQTQLTVVSGGAA